MAIHAVQQRKALCRSAQRSLYTAQQVLILLRLGKLANQVRLYAVLGGGSDQDVPQEGGS